MDQATFDKLTEQSRNNITAKVICDSVNPDGCRLTTMEWTYPRFIHSEIMTHRKLSRNATSSRAIPLSKMIQRVKELPVFPIYWGRNQKGMQASEELNNFGKLEAAKQWMYMLNYAIERCSVLENYEVHKQIGNRLLEPWMWITVIVSATNFENLFGLRCHPAAEPHFQNLAYKVREAFDSSTPNSIPWGGWHLPYIGSKYEKDAHVPFYAMSDVSDLPKISAGRCARVSYLTHDGKRDPAEDIRLYTQLAGSFPLHASPLEHPAQAVNPEHPEEQLDQDTIRRIGIDTFVDSQFGEPRYILNWGNFDPGWLQYRKFHENENITKRIQL